MVTYVECCCGIGGFGAGIKRVCPEARCLLAADADGSCRDVFRRNHGVTPHGDLFDVPSSSVPHADILCAGIPCQSFSVAGFRRATEDARFGVYVKVLDVVAASKPRVVVLENVANLVKIHGGTVRDMIVTDLTRLGYTVSHAVLNTNAFGLPQNRARVFFVAVRSGRAFDFAALEPHPWPRLSELLDKDHGEPYLPSNTYTMLPSENQKQQNKSGMIFTGFRHGNLRIHSDNLFLSRVHQQHNTIWHSRGAYPTITKRGASRKYVFDGVGVRRLNMAELYRVQGFTDSFQRHQRRGTAIRHLGNSVSPVVVAAMALQMRIISLDIGTKSLGMATLDTATTRLDFGTHDLTKGVPKKRLHDYPHLVRRFIASTPAFAAADVVLVERQMSPVMKQVAVCFVCFLYDKAVVVSPRSVKCHLATSCGRYDANKHAAVAYVLSEACALMSPDHRVTLRCLKAKQRSDCADAVCQIVWYLDKFKV